MVLNVRMMLNVSFFLSSSRSFLCSPTFPALTQTLSLPIETSWTLCFRVYHSFPITIFPEGPKFPVTTVQLFFCGHQSCSDSSIPFLLLEATGSGLSIISALLGVKGKVASFSRLLDQQTHLSHWSIRAASMCFCACQQRCPRLTYTHHPAMCSDQDIKDNLRKPRRGERESG